MAGVADYISEPELQKYIKGESAYTDEQSAYKIISTKTNGIEGLPYQFMNTVDRRIFNTDVGRKYGERIFARLPLLFLTPCEPLFMDNFSDTQKNVVAQALIGGIDNWQQLINKTGKYYTVSFNYSEYYKYVNTMLACVSSYLGIYSEKIKIGNKEPQEIGKIDWSNELNDDFKTFFSSKENVIFYLDGLTSVSESFSNETTESSLASQINGFSDQANEIKFLFGKDGNVVSELVNTASQVQDNITSALSGLSTTVAGGIVGSLAQSGVNTVLNGGKIIFPEIWSNSNFDRSYSIEIKLRSPDHDNLSIFLNILKPYCKILALVLPRQFKNASQEIDPNSYSAPFLVKAACKGMFNIDMGIISSMTVTKGAECCWNDSGLPTQIDISLEIKDLYNHMAMNSYDYLHPVNSLVAVVNNTSYMDFLANMAGLNILQMEVGRRIAMVYYLTNNMVATAVSAAFTRFDQGVSKLIGKLYNIL